MGEKVEGGGMAEADMGGEGMQCSDHPYRSNPGGICAFCLQEKLGKLVSSSNSSVDPFFSLPPHSASSSSPTSFLSSDPPASTSSTAISFLSSKHHSRRTKKKTPTSTAATTAKADTAGPNSGAAILKRSKSVAPRPLGPQALAEASDSPRKKSFWSFLSLSYSSSAILSSVSTKRRSASSALHSIAGAGGDIPKAVKEDEKTPRREHQEDASASAASATGEDDISPCGSQASSSFGRKVSRSRSVGCGSRSFSGDFLERISNGFGDCTLRRVESHRESKSKASIHRRDRQGNADDEVQIMERVKCGGFFGGLGLISSSTYWLSATSAADAFDDRLPATRRCGAPHSRSKSWGWAFASPLRAFRPAGSGGIGQSTIMATGVASRGGRGGPANPSLLVVRG